VARLIAGQSEAMSMLTKSGAKQFLRTLLMGVAVMALPPAHAAEKSIVIPAFVADASGSSEGLQTAVLAGGCFWGVQGVFQRVQGVRKVVSGYAGGRKLTAHYPIVSMGVTGHAESVQITYDPKIVSYGKLLQVFFSVVHDPTQLNRQGPDSGSQYRSAIFYSTETEKKAAQAYIAQLEKERVFPRAIVTRVDPLGGFYPAEDYHQDYLLRNPKQPYIVYNDLPKIENFKRLFADIYAERPVTVNLRATD
jgi:peptide-methionine (S)-S-oxide reductase